MSELIIAEKRRQIVSLPHYLLIDGRMLGVFRGEAHIQMPAGRYKVTLRSSYRFIESSADISIGIDDCVSLLYADRERWWNILFNIDLVLWIAKRFITFSEPWDTLYEVASNGFFAIWLLRLWLIRKHYFTFTISHT